MLRRHMTHLANEAIDSRSRVGGAVQRNLVAIRDELLSAEEIVAEIDEIARFIKIERKLGLIDQLAADDVAEPEPSAQEEPLLAEPPAKERVSPPEAPMVYEEVD